ncbi:MAG: hypothetical protein LBV02_02055 [Bacteroidales bacterium]|nr:hypothetical protein [Bacteroidales bacterium]
MDLDPSHSSAKKKKQQELLDFFQRYGFDHSINDIANGLNITHRTIFNRYKSVHNIEKEVLEIWKIDLKRRLNAKFEFCNHAIEKLLFVVIELKRCHHKEEEFFRRVFQTPPCNLFFLEKIIHQIIFSDFKKGYFNEFTDRQSYIPFYIHNIIYFITENHSVDVVIYALHPILSERGYELLCDIALDTLL